jgi:hypothetical protein
LGYHSSSVEKKLQDDRGLLDAANLRARTGLRQWRPGEPLQNDLAAIVTLASLMQVWNETRRMLHKSFVNFEYELRSYFMAKAAVIAISGSVFLFPS